VSEWVRGFSWSDRKILLTWHWVAQSSCLAYKIALPHSTRQSYRLRASKSQNNTHNYCYEMLWKRIINHRETYTYKIYIWASQSVDRLTFFMREGYSQDKWCKVRIKYPLLGVIFMLCDMWHFAEQNFSLLYWSARPTTSLNCHILFPLIWRWWFHDDEKLPPNIIIICSPHSLTRSTVYIGNFIYYFMAWQLS
jgi:hypothetical protein